MNLKNIKLSEKSQTQKVRMARLPLCDTQEWVKTISSDRKELGAWARKLFGHVDISGDDGNVFYLDSCGGSMSIYICKISLKYTLKWVPLLFVLNNSVNLIKTIS